jgi:CheY-like chemotaxis protein
MVEELLDAARLMDGRIDLQRRCVSLNELLHEVCADLSTRAASDNVDLHCEVPETKISIDGDLLRIKQAVENIVRNALDACSGGGSVHVSVIAGGVGEAGIRIADSGRGLSAEDLATLFEPGKSPGLHNGLGLGLKTVHRIVQLHGGRVVARSDGPGTGATFELYFPLFDTRAVIGADPTAAQRSQLIGQRVLIIAGGTDALVAPLEHCGAEVRRAASGFEGIRTAASWSPTAVVCDLDLPSPLTGCDVARQIAAQTAQRPRLIAIGDAGRVDVAAARNAGFDDCLARPIALPRLLATLAQAATFVAAGATA